MSLVWQLGVEGLQTNRGLAPRDLTNPSVIARYQGKACDTCSVGSFIFVAEGSKRTASLPDLLLAAVAAGTPRRRQGQAGSGCQTLLCLTHGSTV